MVSCKSFQGTDINLEISKQAERLIANGADIIDIGGYSSRPGAKDIYGQLETERVLKGIRSVRAISESIPISVDTFRAKVAQEAIDAGASIVNDISGGSLDSDMFQTISENNVSYIMMHMVGNPQNMVQNVQYDDMLTEMLNYFAKKLHELTHFGVKDVIIDVGFGFSKTTDQNYDLLSSLNLFQMLQAPILVGISRKSMIYKILESGPETALNGTTALHAIALIKGAKILRVHDVKEAKEVIDLVKLIN